MTPRPDNAYDTAELLELTAAEVDSSITPEAHARLATILRDHPDARATYLQYRRLHAALDWRTGEQQTSIPQIPPHADAKPAPGEASGTPAPGNETAPAPGNEAPPLSAAGVPMYRKGYEPQPFKLRAHHIALTAATLLAACGLAAYLLTTSVDPEPSPPEPSSPPPVATLIQNTGNLRTPHGYPAEGDDYGRGEYSLDRGTAEFMLTNAVNVKLRGKTRLHMANNMSVSLTRGTAEFYCPKEAKNFTVHLPSGARVVDLGTRFIVKVSESGQQIVYVSEGLVELHQDGQRFTLDAYEARVVPVAGLPTITTDEQRLAMGLPRRGELINNGSFEINTNATPGHAQNSELGPANYAGSTWGDADVTTHWSRSGKRTWYTTDNGTDIFPDGDFAYRLDASSVGGVDALFQDGIVLKAGTTYKLSFAMWGDTGTPRVDVTLSGPASLIVFDDETTDATDGVIEIKTSTFTPDVSGTYRLSFAADDPGNGNQHAWIDNVSLVVVPDPIQPTEPVTSHIPLKEHTDEKPE